MDTKARIKAAREAKGLNKSEFARRISVSPATVTMWESGQIKSYDAANIQRAAEVLGVSPKWLLEGGATMLRWDQATIDFADEFQTCSQELRSLILDTMAAFKGAVRVASEHQAQPEITSHPSHDHIEIPRPSEPKESTRGTNHSFSADSRPPRGRAVPTRAR